MRGKHGVERPPDIGQFWIINASFGIYRREPCRDQHAVAVAQGHVKNQPEMYDHLPARARTTVLQKGDVALRDTSRPSEVELALVPAATPRAEHIAELVTGKQVRHTLTVRDTLDDCDYVVGNRGGLVQRRYRWCLSRSLPVGPEIAPVPTAACT